MLVNKHLDGPSGKSLKLNRHPYNNQQDSRLSPSELCSTSPILAHCPPPLPLSFHSILDPVVVPSCPRLCLLAFAPDVGPLSPVLLTLPHCRAQADGRLTVRIRIASRHTAWFSQPVSRHCFAGYSFAAFCIARACHSLALLIRAPNSPVRGIDRSITPLSAFYPVT